MTDRYAVIGNPVAHSKSPQIHAAFAAETRQDMSYERLLAPLDGFRGVLMAWRDGGAAGANITLPFKFEAHALAGEHSARARRAGAVNTLKFDGEKIIGDNTDGIGLRRDIVFNQGFAIKAGRVLLLGAGGAAHGVAGALLDEQPAVLVIANRTLAKAGAIVAHLGRQGVAGKVRALSMAQLGKQEFDLIINATSASLAGDAPEIPAACFARDCLAYDMMYGMQATPFLQLAASLGARTADGLGMLVEQAAESFLWWRGLRPATAPVLAMLRQTPAARS